MWPPITPSILVVCIALGKALVESLECYTCLSNREKLDSQCEDHPLEVPVQNCTASQPYCMVSRKDIGQGIAMVQRSCEASCRPKCLSAEGKSSCTVCCQTDRCNFTNKAGSLSALTWLGFTAWMAGLAALVTCLHGLL